MKRKYLNLLARKIMSFLLAGACFADTVIFAEAPILPDQRAPGNRQPLVQETANGIPLVNISAPPLVASLGMTMNDSIYLLKGPF